MPTRRSLRKSLKKRGGAGEKNGEPLHSSFLNVGKPNKKPNTRNNKQREKANKNRENAERREIHRQQCEYLEQERQECNKALRWPWSVPSIHCKEINRDWDRSC